MVDLVITPANVKVIEGNAVQGTAGAAVTAGQLGRPDGSKWVPAQANATAVEANLVGIFLNNAALDQPVSVLQIGTVDIGAAVGQGETYVLSAAGAGGVAPIGDLVATNQVSYFGTGSATANQIILGVKPTGIAKA